MRDNGPQSSKEVENSCHVHTGETVKHLYELRAGGCSKRLQLVSIGPNWSRSADSFGSNKVERSEGGQMVHFGHTEGVDGCKETGQDDGQTGKRRKGEFLPLQQKVMGVSKGRKPLGNLD